MEQSGANTKAQGAFTINFDEIADESDDDLYERGAKKQSLKPAKPPLSAKKAQNRLRQSDALDGYAGRKRRGQTGERTKSENKCFWGNETITGGKRAGSGVEANY